jgi:hypothetical protein
MPKVGAPPVRATPDLPVGAELAFQSPSLPSRAVSASRFAIDAEFYSGWPTAVIRD